MEIELSRLVDALPGLVWTARPDGHAEYVGKRWLDFAGLTLEQAVGVGWTSALHPDDAPGVLARWSAIIASGEPGELEARLRRHDGEYRWFLFRACPMPEDDGAVTRWCGMNFDIDDRVRAEATVRAHRQRFERILDGLPAIAALFSPTGKIIFCNRRMLEYLDATLQDIQGRPSAYNFHPDDRDEVLTEWSSSIRTGKPFNREARLQRADGDYRWHRTMVFPLRDADGEIELWYGLSTDIEDEKRADAKLASEKQLLELVATGGPLTAALEAICLQVESLAPGSLCSILVVEPDRQHFRLGGGPSLPAGYNAVLDGVAIDPTTGPCSLAVTLKVPVISADVAGDLRWTSSPLLPLAAEHGLVACWSMPILSAQGEAMGTFAVYRHEPASPRPDELELIDRFAKIAGIAIGRAQAEAALMESEAELRRANDFLAQAQRLSETGSFTWDAHPEKQVWSDEAYRILGLDPGTIVTVPQARELVHPEDRHLFDAMVARGQANLDMDMTYRIVTPQGTVKHVRTIAHRLGDMRDRAVYLGAVQDVTEAKVAEAALKASEAELRRAHDHLTEGQRLSKTGSFTVDVTPDDHIWSEEFYRIFEVEPGAAPSMQVIRDRIHPDDLEGYDLAVARAVADLAPFEWNYRILPPSGLKYVHAVSHPIDHPSGRPVFMGALQDVTESKLAELALKASEADLRRANSELLRAHGHITAAQRVSQTGSFTWDLVADEHHWSDELYRITELDPAVEINLQRVRDSIHPEDHPALDAALERAMAGHEFEYSGRIVTPRGAIKHFRIAGHRIDDIADRPVFVGAVQDVTESKLAEEALNKARAELAHVARVTALSALTASIAHEVNQPLAGIITNASTCLRMLAADPPNLEGARATAQRTIRDGNRASEVIQRLRALFARKPPGFEPVDLNDAAVEVLALTASELQSHRVVLRIELAETLPALRGDRVQLQQVILNLLVNAADAMKAVEGRPRNLTIRTAADGQGQVTLSVRDSGVGLEPQNIERLFDAFYTTKPQGMGVGLAVSRSIIESHGGRLWAGANEDGQGATFAFSIPLGAEPDEAADAPQARTAVAAAEGV